MARTTRPARGEAELPPGGAGPAAPSSRSAANGDLSRALRDHRDLLRSFEGTALAQVAEALSGAARSLAETAERLDRAGGKAILTAEEAAAELGFVDEEGNLKTRAFAKMAAECGFRRHVANRTNIYYIKKELLEDVGRLPG